ncbi:gamma-glutamyltranspeptidase [Desulfolithobacter dissulfuricans]|uniref:Gamma-glutamyltranspeptidase n=1 Tax=Desulfolithobacter dissulfuricans TaxID=2795293 RepID=A0A915U010_9BACT|nr:gamma-glutamyltransferase [Desulfolithobacter dissulfuricans]BCO08469.1 gamma-glutamyltranspeptidase [Desulfolithobacter dissulfuricans]
MTDKEIRYTRSVVATGHELVSQAAADILGAGGNAFDAAVAAGFAGAVAEQTLTSLGGGGFLLARTSGKDGPVEEIVFDFFVDTPGRGLAEMPRPHFFPVTVQFGGSDQEFNIGLGSVAVPGTLKGLLHVHERLGRLPLADILSPAIDLARGHRLNDFQAGFLRLLHPIVTLTPEGRALYEPGDQFLRPGDVLQNPALAAFLQDLVKDRGASFYRGDIARVMARDMREGGGLLTLEDLAGYQVVERKPLRARYRDHTLLTVGPPSLGGSLIALSLAIQEQLEPVDTWGSAEYLLRTTGLMQTVEQLREQGVTSPEALEKLRTDGALEQAAEKVRLFSRGTTHLSIADREGNIASMTCSNGEGSGYFAPGTGIMLNNMMGEDDLHPQGFHSSPPGIRVSSMMSPSALLRDGEVELVLGSGGSKRIRTAITQVLVQVIDYGRDIETAVQAPRLHWDGSVVQVEPGFADQDLQVLEQRVAINVWQEKNVYFGGVHTVVPGSHGVGDPRRGGAVRVVEE